MGLAEFLKEVRSVEDIVKGVLIGLEPNARKNRRGSKLEAVLGSLISSTIEKINRKHKANLTFEAQMYVGLANERKKIDYVILQNTEPKIAIEVNFYSTSGSKPSEVLGRAYPEVQVSLKRKGLGFIVITDGIGWESMRPVISTAYEKLDCLMNIKQAKSGELEKAILSMLK
jgi:type II restriction enzyme